jgi:hypothetical protein
LAGSFTKAITRSERPVPCGSETAPRTVCSVFFTSMPRFTAMFTVSSNFAGLADLRILMPSASG